MQDAYAVEANKIGSWQAIGYTGPGSNSSGGSASAIFTYNEVDADVDAGTAGWTAKPNSKLNDCDTGNSWTLYAQYITSGAQQGNVGYAASGDAVCTDLTPAFDKLDDSRGS